MRSPLFKTSFVIAVIAALALCAGVRLSIRAVSATELPACGDGMGYNYGTSSCEHQPTCPANQAYSFKTKSCQTCPVHTHVQRVPTFGYICAGDVYCGNGVLDHDANGNWEACDLGDSNGKGLGCTADCKVQEDWTCTSNGQTSRCTKDVAVCGDGKIIKGEKCDYTISGSLKKSVGCSQYESCSNCQKCIPDPNFDRCGNGHVSKENGKQCDTGNVANSYGCSAQCTVVPGWKCNNASPSVCTHIRVCGDGIIDKGEQCDDGNLKNGDGCTNRCKLEKGWKCHTVMAKPPYQTLNATECSRDYSVAICGDGLRFSGEQCDDGNLKNGDGCSSQCKVEKKWKCEGGSQAGPDTCHR